MLYLKGAFGNSESSVYSYIKVGFVCSQLDGICNKVYLEYFQDDRIYESSNDNFKRPGIYAQILTSFKYSYILTLFSFTSDNISYVNFCKGVKSLKSIENKGIFEDIQYPVNNSPYAYL